MAVQHEKTTTYILTWCLLRPSFQQFDSLTDCGMSHANLSSFVCGVLPTIMFTILFCSTTLYSLGHGRDVLSLMSTYTGQGDQEGMRKTNFCPESNPSLITSKPAHQTLSHDHQIKVCPLISSYNCSGCCLTGNLTLQTIQIMCRKKLTGN